MKSVNVSFGCQIEACRIRVHTVLGQKNYGCPKLRQVKCTGLSRSARTRSSTPQIIRGMNPGRAAYKYAERRDRMPDDLLKPHKGILCPYLSLHAIGYG